MPPTSESFPFLSLPPEIRILIYHHVFSPAPLLSRPTARPTFTPPSLPITISIPSLALAQTCRQVRAETLDLVVAGATHHLADADNFGFAVITTSAHIPNCAKAQLRPYLEGALERAPLAHRQAVRRLSLAPMSARALFCAFDVERGRAERCVPRGWGLFPGVEDVCVRRFGVGWMRVNAPVVVSVAVGAPRLRRLVVLVGEKDPEVGDLFPWLRKMILWFNRWRGDTGWVVDRGARTGREYEEVEMPGREMERGGREGQLLFASLGEGWVQHFRVRGDVACLGFVEFTDAHDHDVDLGERAGTGLRHVHIFYGKSDGAELFLRRTWTNMCPFELRRADRREGVSQFRTSLAQRRWPVPNGYFDSFDVE